MVKKMTGQRDDGGDVKTEAIIFDLGDTLVDLGEGRGSYETHVLARTNKIYDLLAAAGILLPDREVFCEGLATGSEARYQAALAEQRGMDIYDVFRWFFNLHDITVDDVLLEACVETYARGGGAPTPMRIGAIDLLQRLQADGYRLGVISNTLQPGRFLDQSLVRRGIFDYFPVRVYSSDEGVAKPHPAIFRAALTALGVSPERALYVGDRLAADVAGAQGVGMKAVLIEVAHRPEVDPHVVPDARIRELPELLDVLPGLDGDVHGSRTK